MMPSYNQPQTAAIASLLPTEVLDIILVWLSQTSPEGIAALAQTCRILRTHIYRPPDQHLWREIFLVKYDDPRECSRFMKEPILTVDWAREYQERVYGTRLFRKSYTEKELPLVHLEGMGRILSAVLSIFHLSRPYTRPPSSSKGCETEATSARTEPKLPSFTTTFRSMPMYPTLLPSSSQSTYQESKSLHEFLDATSHGVPEIIWTRIQSKFIDKEWDVTPEAQSFYHIISLLGCIPIQDVAEEKNASKASSSQSELITDLQEDILCSARKRIYDIYYARAESLYGPFRKAESHYSSPIYPAASRYVVPDWAQIASIRLVTSQAYRVETVTDADALSWMDGRDNLRSGFWTPGSHTSHDKELPSSSSEAEGQGHDWAGVEGCWRRLVTWLGYDILMGLNHEYDGDWPDIDELQQCLIVPLRLRIVGYDFDSLVSPRFPTIKVEGEMGGEDWDETSDAPESDLDIRRVFGTVSMLYDGSVRWSLTSMNNNELEWLSEGVQIGGIGSMAGIVGLWTSAENAGGAEEPIGGWWQWRVA